MPSRIRLLTDSVISTSRHFKYDGGNSHLTLNFVAPHPTWPSYYRFMSDVVGNPEGINPAYQVVMNSTVSRVSNFYNADGASISQLDSYPVLIDPSLMHTNGMIVTPTAAQFSSWSVEAFNAFHDQIPTEFSVGNFLYELRDIKGMIPKIESSVVKTASSNFLAFEFGIKPFVGDVSKMLTLMATVAKRLEYLRETFGKEVGLYFSRKVDEPTGSPNFDIHQGADLDPFTAGGCNWKFRRVGYKGTFSASTKLIQKLEGLSDMSSNIKAYAAALGLNNPAAIVWEAIPYSFVVDWFFKVGKLLNSLAIQPFGGEWSLRDTVNSFKDEYVYLVDQDFYPNIASTKVFAGQVSIRRFSRNIGLPVSSVFATDLTLTPKQQALSLALLDQLR